MVCSSATRRPNFSNGSATPMRLADCNWAMLLACTWPMRPQPMMPIPTGPCCAEARSVLVEMAVFSRVQRGVSDARKDLDGRKAGRKELTNAGAMVVCG